MGTKNLLFVGFGFFGQALQIFILLLGDFQKSHGSSSQLGCIVKWPWRYGFQFNRLGDRCILKACHIIIIYVVRPSTLGQCFLLEGGILPLRGFPGGASGKEPASQCRRCKGCGLDPCVGKLPWRRAWPPTPVFLPGESHGQRSLGGCSPLGYKESDMTEVTWHMHTKGHQTKYKMLSSSCLIFV